MNCPNCGFENPSNLRFCGSCGTRLTNACPECGFANPMSFRFCGMCGTRLITEPALAPADQPAIHLNKELMERIRPQMTRYYYHPKKYSSYLEQLGIAYPGTPASAVAAGAAP